MVARRSSTILMRRAPRRRAGRLGAGPGVLAAGVAAVAVLAATRPVRRVEVAGTSMAPALLPGDRLVVLRRPPVGRRWPAPGAVVAVRDPRVPTRVLVKRVGSVDRGSGTVEVLGDSADGSTDSRTFGPVPRSAVVGRAVYRYAPAGRTGRGPWSKEYARP